MRNKVSSVFGNSSVRFLVLALLASAATGCSSDVTRFGGIFASRNSNQDNLTTASIPHQVNAVNGQVPIPVEDVQTAAGNTAAQPNYANSALNQPYPAPANNGQYGNMNMATNVSGARLAATPQKIERVALASPSQGKITNSVSNGVAGTVAEKKQALAQAFPTDNTIANKKNELVAAADPVMTGKVKSGWSTINAPAVSLKPGESVASLSKRYGVPEKEILKANGLASAKAVAPGQTVVIPVYSNGTTLAAPVAAQAPAPAKAIVDTKTAAADTKKQTPVPVKVPGQGQAILPDTVALRDKNGKVLANQKVASAAPSKAPQAATGGYQVQSGDSLVKIAKKLGVSVDDLKAANGITDKPIKVGQTLKMPGAVKSKAQVASATPATKPATAKTKVAPAETAASTKVIPDKQATASVPPAKATDVASAQKPEPYKAPVIATESVTEAAAKVDPDDAAPAGTGIGKYRWPVRGAVIAGYGSNVDGNRNDGIDISVPQGTPVKAAENGVVIYSGNGLKELGNTVLIRHEDGTVTVYGNADQLSVTRGQKVTRGQVIANSGMSGNAARPKLHFEVRKNATAVNPMTFLD